jgi:OOP family OmpA-OmpF porin
MGSDTDFAVHAGLGVKYPFDDVISARLDLRDTMSQEDQHSNGDIAHHPEVLLGLTMTLDRSKPAPSAAPPPPDGDADGIADAQDSCPAVAGAAPNGCPPDSDGDKVIDSEDKCPLAAGLAPDGCPPPPDRDGDKTVDADDDCPDVPGDFKRGCPNPDPDSDGVTAEQDKCPSEAETANGYQDADGCPDELPAAVKKFSGVIAGIEFDLGKATIRPVSRPILDSAIETLKAYPELKILVTGHTDNVGKRETNVELSKKRADSVKDYLLSKGIEVSRITTRGAGPDEPLEAGDTQAARQKNRRIEFKLVQ